MPSLVGLLDHADRTEVSSIGFGNLLPVFLLVKLAEVVDYGAIQIIFF